MIKNDVCLGGASKQNRLFLKKCSTPMPQMSRFSPVTSDVAYC